MVHFNKKDLKIMKKIRVLHILDELNTGGAERIVVSYFQNIDRDCFQWDFIITRYADPNKKGLLEPIVEELGGKIYRVTRKRKNYIKNINEIAKIIKDGNYDIVHSHLDELSTYYLSAAKKAGVPVRICHSHLAGADRGKAVELLCRYLKPKLEKTVTDRFACGIEAGKALWGDEAVEGGNVYIMRNAIRTDKFYFNQAIRERVRTNLGIEGRFAFGTVGRLSYQKNSVFLIEIMKELHKMQPAAILLIVGEGNQRTTMEDLVSRYNLQNNVFFLGSRNDVNEIMMGMDAFLLPSRFEGLPIVLIEAQCTGLPCLVSDSVTREVKVNGNVKFLPIDNAEKLWAKECAHSLQNEYRENAAIHIVEAGYEIKRAAKDLELYYIEALGRCSC